MSFSAKLARSLSAFDDRNSLRFRLRIRRLQPLMRMIESVHQQKGSVTIIDIGGTRRYWNLLPDGFLESNNVRITIVNLPGSDLPDNEGRFSYAEGDGCDLQGVDEASFDIAHSNSVVEHVGDWGRMRQFAGEVKRVARRHYVQTPSFWFPVEPHCMTPVFHWLPKPWRVALVMRFALGHWARAASVDEAVEIVESARLLDRKMFGALFPDESIQTERMLLWPKSYSVLRDQQVMPAARVEGTSGPTP